MANSIESNPRPIHVDSMQDVGGILTRNTLEGEQASLLAKAFFSSDQPQFHLHTPKLLSALLPTNAYGEINSALILRHHDGSGDVFVDNVPLAMCARTRRPFKKGDYAALRDFVDIETVFLDPVSVAQTDKLVLLFRFQWKFGLFFDLTGCIDTVRLPAVLGDCMRSLAYAELYSAFATFDQQAELQEDGWFPFLEFLPDDFPVLVSFYSESDLARREALISHWLGRFGRERISAVVDRWWQKTQFSERKEILEAGVANYLTDTPSGFISSVKTLYTEIEGVLISAYRTDLGGTPNLNDLKTYLRQRGRSRFSRPTSLGLPNQFLDYLGNDFFGKYDLSSERIPVSRNTAGHGVLPPDGYTKARALQGILVLDQIWFYL